MKTINVLDIHNSTNKLIVYLFNVGQGDHILMKFPSGEYGLIDFYYDIKNNTPEPPALSFFKMLKVILNKDEFDKITISFLCISHTDKDHCKGIGEALKWFIDEGVFIKEFWLGGAKDQIQFEQYFKEKIPALLKNMEDKNLEISSEKIKLFNTGLNEFFQYLKKWKRVKKVNLRYKNEESGDIEYLAEIRALRSPSKGVTVTNMGPLAKHLDDYNNKVNLATLKKLLNLNIDSKDFNKNAMSHILKLQYGDNVLLFGGDTNKKVWKDCLKKYTDLKLDIIHGSYKSNFIKVSHHGSKNSSDKAIYQEILHATLPINIGVSAGQHSGYKHPDPKTIRDIKSVRSDAEIFCTNVCCACLKNDIYRKEMHSWYDEFLDLNKNYKKHVPNDIDKSINFIFNNMSRGIYDDALENIGLFGYVFIYGEVATESHISVAMSSSIHQSQCFYNTYDTYLCNNCNGS